MTSRLIKVIFNLVKKQSFFSPDPFWGLYIANLLLSLIVHSSLEIACRPNFIDFFYSNDFFMFNQNDTALISIILLSRSVHCFGQNRYSWP